MDILPDHWATVFVPEMPLLELLARAAILYFGILMLLRVFPRRTGGELTAMDLVLILLITEAASHALGDFSSLTDGLILIVFMMGLNLLVNTLSYRFGAIEKLVSAPPLQIVRDGRVLPRNLRREFLTADELESYLRQNDIDDISEVKEAFVEGEGHITFVTYDRK
jgi:uncharacterized membrane protein YcaP (DUF421 family)